MNHSYTKKIAARVAAISSLKLLFIGLGLMSYSTYSSADEYDLQCQSQGNKLTILISNQHSNELATRFLGKNGNSISTHTSGNSRSHMSFSLDNFPMNLTITTENSEKNYLINEACEVKTQ